MTIVAVTFNNLLLLASDSAEGGGSGMWVLIIGGDWCWCCLVGVWLRALGHYVTNSAMFIIIKFVMVVITVNICLCNNKKK